MSGEKAENNSAGQAAANEWDSLADVRMKTDRINDKLDDLIKAGTITEERADALRVVREKAAAVEASEREDLQARLAAMGARTGEETYEGEQNLNSRTGKERTDSDFDLYPRMAGETSAEYGERLRRMHEMTRAYEEQEKFNLEEDEKRKLEEEEKRKLEEEERKKQGIGKGENHDPIGVAPPPIELIEVPGDDLEGLSDEELEKRRREIEEKKKRTEEEIAKLQTPLSIINLDLSHDQRVEAHDAAVRDLNNELSEAKGFKGFIKKIWKGSMFKEYYQMKYEKEYLEGERKIGDLTIEDVVARRSKSTYERFVKGITEDEYVHRSAGEDLEKADPETSEKVKAAIAKFAEGYNPDDPKTVEKLKYQLQNDLGFLAAEGRDGGKKIDQALFDRYYEVAVQAGERAHHGIGMEHVMEGFAVYNAKVREGVRTDAHRKGIERAVHNFKNTKIGSVIPETALIGAATIAYGLTRTGSRAALGVFGGIAVNSVFAGIKAADDATGNRTTRLRDRAYGEGYENADEEGEISKEDIRKLPRRERKTARYEQKIGGTLYQMEPAANLTANLERALAMEPGEERDKALRAAITEARIRVDFSDLESKDLISYSSRDKVGDERLALDTALITAEKSLSPEQRELLATEKSQLQTEITDSVSELDKKFKHFRAAQATKKALKTAGIGVATFFASQEIAAAFDPNKIGILEKLGVGAENNNADASETLLAAGLFGRSEISAEVSSDDLATRERLEQAGYKETKISDPTVSEEYIQTEVDIADSTDTVNVKMDWANNGSSVSDGNELNLFRNSNGDYFARMPGNSTMPDGSSVNLFSSGEPVAIVNIGGQNFEIPAIPGSLDPATGQVAFTVGDYATTTNGTVIKIAEGGKKLFKTFSVGFKNGANINGAINYTSMATDIGSNAPGGTVTEVVKKVVEIPGKSVFTRLRSVWHGGIALAPNLRDNLGRTGVAPEGNDGGKVIDTYTVGGTGSGATREIPGATNPPAGTTNGVARDNKTEATPTGTTISGEGNATINALNAFNNLSDEQRTEAISSAFNNMNPEARQGFLEALFNALLGGNQTGQAA